MADNILASSIHHASSVVSVQTSAIHHVARPIMTAIHHHRDMLHQASEGHHGIGFGMGCIMIFTGLISLGLLLILAHAYLQDLSYRMSMRRLNENNEKVRLTAPRA